MQAKAILQIVNGTTESGARESIGMRLFMRRRFMPPIRLYSKSFPVFINISISKFISLALKSTAFYWYLCFVVSKDHFSLNHIITYCIAISLFAFQLIQRRIVISFSLAYVCVCVSLFLSFLFRFVFVFSM